MNALSIFAEATDDLGRTSLSAPVDVTVLPDSPPVVSIESPGEGEVLLHPSRRQFNIRFSDNGGVARLQVFANGVQTHDFSNLGTGIGISPFLDVPQTSSLTVEVRATDNLGRSTTVSRVYAVVPDPAPSLTLTAPMADATLYENSTVDVQATAFDNVSVSAVRFFVGDVLIATDTSYPYSTSYFLAPGRGTLNLAVEAVDNLGQISRVEGAWSVLPDPPPTIAILSPIPGSTLRAGQQAFFSISATDNTSVSDVRILVDGNVIATRTSVPYEAAYLVPFGATTLHLSVEARDAGGRTSQAQADYTVETVTGEARLVVEPASIDFVTNAGYIPTADAGLGPLAPPVRTALAQPAPSEPPGLRFEALGTSRPDGQAAERFVAHSRGMSVLLEPDGVTLALGKRISKGTVRDTVHETLRLRFEGAEPGVRLAGTDPSRTRVNHLGGPKEDWRTNVPTYAKVRSESLYQGIDAAYYSTRDGELEYDLILEPGADLSQVRLVVEGARKAKIDRDGSLVIEGRHGIVKQLRPVAYQLIDGERAAVDVHYVKLAKNRFEIRAKAFDANRTLVVDPVLRYSTYLGGTSSDSLTGVAVDSAGSVYITGLTGSVNFPLSGGAFGTGSTQRFFVSKFDAAGAPVFTTFVSAPANTTSIAVDAAGRAFVTGFTYSDPGSLPLVRAVRSTAQNGDAFVTGLTADGSALTLSTYLGGSGSDHGAAIAVDGAGSIVVAGSTSSSDLPVTGGVVQPVMASPPNSTPDAFAMKIAAPDEAVLTAPAIMFATYLGGSEIERVTGVAVDGIGNVLVTGYTASPNFPTTVGAYQTSFGGGADSFVTKISPDGRSFGYSTYLGGSAGDVSGGIGVTADGSALLAGTTYSADFPITSSRESAWYGQWWYAAKVSAAGDALVYSTVKAGVLGDIRVAVDPYGSPHIFGTTGGFGGFGEQVQLPTSTGDALWPYSSGGREGYYAKLNAQGQTAYATFLGGWSSEEARGVAVDHLGSIYLGGYTNSPNFPTASAIQSAQSVSGDGFLTRLDFKETLSVSDKFTYGEYTEGLLVTRRDARDRPISVDYEVVPGTARPHFDYTPVSGTLVFEPGEVHKFIYVPAVDDTIAEGNETYLVYLTNPTEGVELARTHAVVTVVDDDAPPAVRVLHADIQIRDAELAAGPQWQASLDVPWLTLSQTSGDGPNTVTVTADATGLSEGIYTGHVTVTAGALDSPRQVLVTLTVRGEEVTASLSQATVEFSNAVCSAEAGSIATIAGSGVAGFGGDGGLAISAELSAPGPTATDPGGAIFFADNGNFRIRHIDPSGVITTVVGTGVSGLTGDDGPGSLAAVGTVGGVALGSDGSLYFSDTEHHVIRRLDPLGLVSRVAGTGLNEPGEEGVDALLTAISAPFGLAFDEQGRLLFAESGANRVRRIEHDGTVTTVAGSGVGGFSDGPVLEATFARPTGLTHMGGDRFRVADTDNHAVREFQLGFDAYLYTVVGSEGSGSGSARNLPWESRQLDSPKALANLDGVTVIVDSGNHRVRTVGYSEIVENEIVETAAGTGAPGDGGEAGSPHLAALRGPEGLAVLGGAYVVADTGNNKLKLVAPNRGRFYVDLEVGAFGAGLGPEWSASSSVPWVTISPASGRGVQRASIIIDLTRSGVDFCNYGTSEVTITVTSPALSAPIVLRLQILGRQGE